MRFLPPRSSLFSAAFVIVAISGAALVWNGPAASPWSSAGGVVDEYRSEASHLQLAPGWHWPKELPFDAGTPEAPMHYQKGFGRGEADYRWLCSWTTRAVLKTLSPKARREALEQLATKMHDPAFMEDFPKFAVAKALRGETTELRDYVSNNCRTP